MTKRFALTEDHIALLRHMYVGWCDDEYGAPEIDPKRPYGNSSVELDICEILGWPEEGDEEPGTYGNYSDGQRERAAALHQQTRLALQIVLREGEFRPGLFENPDPYLIGPWRRVEGGAS